MLSSLHHAEQLKLEKHVKNDILNYTEISQQLKN